MVMAGPALADPPVREVFEFEDDRYQDVCGFPTLENVSAKVIRTTYSDAEGRVTRVREVYPHYVTTVTNLETGATIKVNIPGPSFTTFNRDGSTTLVGTGPWSFLDHPDTGEPGYYLLKGRFELTTSADGEVTFTRVGKVESLCDDLA
jgi:hypothetical protein